MQEVTSLRDYTIKNHRKGVEVDHARIGIQIALNWIWPLAYDQEDWEKMNAMPGFDPDTRLYCYLGDEMVDCMFWQANPQPRESLQRPLSTSRECSRGTNTLLN